MKICLFGSSGLVGSGIRRNLTDFSELLLPSKNEVNLEIYSQINNYLKIARPDLIIMAAGLVGGINFNIANQLSLFESNLLMNLNLLKASYENKISKFCLISSSCIYPSIEARPYTESKIFNGLPEQSNEGYALAKSTSIRILRIYRQMGMKEWFTVVPTNVYGLEDDFSENGHLIGSVIRKIYLSKSKNEKQIYFFGTGKAKRQFISNNDLGKAINYLIKKKSIPEIINLSNRQTFTVKEVILEIADIIGYNGDIIFDGNQKLDGNLDKTLSLEILEDLNWKSESSLDMELRYLIKNLSI
jgi:GDP-L-fucose synthase